MKMLMAMQLQRNLLINSEKTVNLSSVHVTLYRLEDKGLVKSMMGGATAVRGGGENGFLPSLVQVSHLKEP